MNLPSRKRNLPLQTSTRVLGKKCDSQVLYHGVFTMYICQSLPNIRLNPSLLIKNILSNCKMNIIPANARFNAMVDSWNASNRPVLSKLPTVIFKVLLVCMNSPLNRHMKLVRKNFCHVMKDYSVTKYQYRKNNCCVFTQNY